jgi:outer membrane protein TolC
LGWNGGNNWTAGLELKVDLFSGGAKQAQLQREKARMEQIDAYRRSLEDRVKLEVRRAYYDHASARQQLTVSKTASEQASESLRILRDRYESGLVTVTELLRAEEAKHKTQIDYWEAVYQTQTSYALLELATGELTVNSPVVTQ